MAHNPVGIGIFGAKTERPDQEKGSSTDGHTVRRRVEFRRLSTEPGMIARGVGLLAVLFAVIFFADSDQAERVAADSLVLAATERSLTSTDLIRANVGIGIVLASAEAAGIDSADRWPAALANSVAAHAELLNQLGDLNDSVLTDKGEVIGSQLSQINVLLEAGDLDAADLSARSDLVPLLDTMTASLLLLRDEVGSRIEAERSTAGSLAQATSITIAVLGPLLAVLAYRALSQRRQTKADLEAALASERQLVVAKDQIIANLSHELRTPLTSIYGFASLLVEGLSGHPRDRHAEMNRSNAQMILSESADLSRMVDDLLTAVRSDEVGVAIRLETLSARVETTKVLQPFVQAGTVLNLSIEDAPIWADALRFRQIVRNLVSNAQRHGGPHIAVIGRPASDCYELAIVDNGPGAPDSVRERMFERFVHRGSEPLVAGSLGLGLSIARALAELMGGTLRYERSEGLTRFVVTMPLSAELPPARPLMIGAAATGNRQELVEDAHFPNS